MLNGLNQALISKIWLFFHTLALPNYGILGNYFLCSLRFVIFVCLFLCVTLCSLKSCFCMSRKIEMLLPLTLVGKSDSNKEVSTRSSRVEVLISWVKN